MHFLNRWSFLSWILRSLSVPALMIMSSAYPWLSYALYVLCRSGVCVDGLYPLLQTESDLRSGSMSKVKRSGERVSPCSAPSVYWDFSGVDIWGHVVGARGTIELFTRLNVLVRESNVFFEFEEQSGVHASKRTFEV